MSDTYGKLLARLWTDPEMRALNDRDFRIFAYLLSNRHRSLSGCYYLPIVLAAHELGMRCDDLELALYHRLAAWVRYDHRTEEVWVRSLAAVNCDQPHDRPYAPRQGGKKEDSRLPALRRSVEAIASSWLRGEWMAYYAAWNAALALPVPPPADAPTLHLVRGVDAPSDAPPTGGGGGVDAPPTPVAVAVAVAGSSNSSSSSNRAVESDDSTGAPLGSLNPPAEAAKRGRLRGEAGALMPVIRECFYGPGGEPPPGYDDGRDYRIVLQLLEQGVSATVLEVGIRGVAMMRDAGEFERWTPPVKRGAKMTMRMLFNTRHGVVQMLEAAAATYYRSADQAPRPKHGQPTALGKVLAGLR